MIHLNLPFYHRYIDDIVLAASQDQIINIINICNSLHTCLHTILLRTIFSKTNFLEKFVNNLHISLDHVYLSYIYRSFFVFSAKQIH